MTMRPPLVEEEEEVQLNDDLEQLLWDINEFCGKAADKQDEIPENLETYIKFVAKTGNTIFPWQHVRPLFRNKMLKAINEFGGEPSPVEPFIFERFDIFRGAPFTIQRLAELITNPKRHYKVKDKYLRGLEKTVLVVTTIEPSSSGSGDDEENANQDDSNPWLEPTESGSTNEPSLVEPPSDNNLSSHEDDLTTSVEELEDVEDANVAIVETVDVVDGLVEEQPENMDEDDGQGISGTTMPPGMNTSGDEVNAPIPSVVIEEVVKDSDPADLLDIPTEALAVEPDSMEIEATVAEVTAVIETVISPELYAQAAEDALATVEGVCVEAGSLVGDLLVNADDALTSGATPIVEEPQPEVVTTTDSTVEETPVSTISEVAEGTPEESEAVVTGSDLPTVSAELSSDVSSGDGVVDSSS